MKTYQLDQHPYKLATTSIYGTLPLNIDVMEGDQTDFMDFDLPLTNSAHAEAFLMETPSGNQQAPHVHVDAIVVHEDLFDDDDLS